jgi:hypothetical protein
MALVAGAFSVHGVAVTGAGGAPVPCVLGEGRPMHPSPLNTMRNSSVEFSIMAHHGDGVPLRVEPMKAAAESLLLGRGSSR